MGAILTKNHEPHNQEPSIVGAFARTRSLEGSMLWHAGLRAYHRHTNPAPTDQPSKSRLKLEGPTRLCSVPIQS